MEEPGAIGVEDSQEHFHADYEEQRANAIRALMKSQEKLQKLEGKLSRMTKGSNNYGRMQERIDKLRVHMANQRRDLTNKEARRRVDRNRAVTGERDLSTRDFAGTSAREEI
ncbi:MAG: hypothetical protein IJ088_04325 [Clostridia bacterium]|nr:hypothetical protein [Clostridia bacterium]